MKWTDRVINSLDDAERVALSLVARIGPWAAPIAPAYFIARAASKHLNAPLAVAVAMGVAVEAVGIAAFIATLRAFTWNQEKKVSDNGAPVWLGISLILIYLIVGIGLAVIVEVFPPIIPWAPAAFFVLAGVAYLVLAMMSDQAHRERSAIEGGQLDRATRAYRAAGRERGLSKAQIDSLLAQASGDPLVALDMLDSASIQSASELAEPEVEPIECQLCGRTFGTMQALNAHGRWCQGSTNGREPVEQEVERR